MTPEEVTALRDDINTLLASAGWRWFEKQARDIANARSQAVMTMTENDQMHIAVARERGAYNGILQVLGLPRNTLAALDTMGPSELSA